MTALAAYEAGLAGVECWIETGRRRAALPVARWTGPADHRDSALVDQVLRDLPCGATVLDVGCGPGRLSAEVVARAERGGVRVRCVGVDLSAAALSMARARGVEAVRLDVLGDLPPDWVGRWDRILLADGNLGIGGDPVRLLRRLRPLLAPAGRVVADVRPHGGVVRATARIRAGAGESAVAGSLPWAWVGASAAASVGGRAGLRLRDLQHTTTRGHDPVVVWEQG